MRYQSIRALLLASGLVIVLTTFAFAQSNSIFLPIVANQSQQSTATPPSDIPPDAVEDTVLERADSAILASLTGQFTLSAGRQPGSSVAMAVGCACCASTAAMATQT